MSRLAGRDYQISESRDGEWTVRWLDPYGDSVAWFSGDVRLIYMALQYLADRTDNEFGITVDRIWRREPELSSQLDA